MPKLNYCFKFKCDTLLTCPTILTQRLLQQEIHCSKASMHFITTTRRCYYIGAFPTLHLAFSFKISSLANLLGLHDP